MSRRHTPKNNLGSVHCRRRRQPAIPVPPHATAPYLAYSRTVPRALVRVSFAQVVDGRLSSSRVAFSRLQADRHGRLICTWGVCVGTVPGHFGRTTHPGLVGLFFALFFGGQEPKRELQLTPGPCMQFLFCLALARTPQSTPKLQCGWAPEPHIANSPCLA